MNEQIHLIGREAETLKRGYRATPYDSPEVTVQRRCVGGDSYEADRHSELIAITVPEWIRSVVRAKRPWRLDFPESDRKAGALAPFHRR